MAEKATTETYLQRYAEPTARWVSRVDADIFGTYASALVVPAYNETLGSISAVLPRISGQTRRLLILVVNQPPDASESAKKAGQKLLVELSSAPGSAVAFQEAPLRLIRGWPLTDSSFDLLVVDATRPEYCLQHKEGVGRARKMGLDAALALQSRGIVCGKMLGSTDSDAILPSDYFDRLEANHAGASALLFPYRHVSSDGGEAPRLMQSVEATFRYYVLGLFYAGSPYAYHSLGSAFAINGQHYAQVRGVPNRMAGEDFHLLAKVAKLAPLKRAQGESIQLITRESERVPFGTGPTFAKALFEFRDGAELQTYHPDVFKCLQVFLRTMSGLVERKATEVPEPGAIQFDFDGEGLGMDRFIHGELVRLWNSLGPRLAECPTKEHRMRRFHEMFDALATLQFIHRAEIDSRPRISLREALHRAPFFSGSLEAPLDFLVTAENELPAWVGPTCFGVTCRTE